MADQILFDKLAYIDRLKRAAFDESQARALADAMDLALRESVATKLDIARLENKIEIAIRDITIRTGAMLVVLGGFLASIKFFG